MKPYELIPFRSISRWVLMLALAIAPTFVRAQSWQATVGAQSGDLGRQALAFLPNEIWIHSGDSVTWTVATDEIHTVTFLISAQIRPSFKAGCPGFSTDPAIFDGSTCVTTPALVKGNTFTVSFPLAGNFKLACLVHTNMTGTVHVLDQSQPLPHDQNFYDDQAAKERRQLLADRDREPDHHSHGSHVTVGTGEIAATAGGSQTLAVERFLEGTIVVHAGKTVEWTNSDPVTRHTITFGIEPPDPTIPSANVTVDQDGALSATINSTSDSVNSGLIVASLHERIGVAQAPLGVTRFRVKFTQAGVYPYICAIHDNLGMKGQVIVLP
jgi:plastocyanin